MNRLNGNFKGVKGHPFGHPIIGGDWMAFIAGAILGASFGVSIMCLMQIAKKSDE